MSGKIKLILAPNYWLHGDAMRGLPYGILPYGVAILKGSLIRGGYAADLCNLIMYMQRLFETRNRFSRLLRGKSYKYRLIRYYLGDNDRAVEKLVDHLLDSIYPDNSRIFGISVSSESCFLPALVLAKRLKERYKAKIVLGGPLINLYSQPIVTKYKYIDYVLRGRCEEPILKLLDYEKGNIGIKEVPNLETVYNNELLINEIKDYRLEDEGLPDYDGFDFEPYYINKEKKQFIIPYRCASGCLGKCIFCLHRVSDKKEYKSLDKVINEIRFLKEKHNTGYFFITDSTINDDVGYLERLCDRLISENINIYWMALAVPKRLKPDLLRKMYKSGNRYLRFGIESGSDRILKILGKSHTVLEAQETLKNCYDIGIKSHAHFMLGIDGESDNDIKSTNEFIIRCKKYICGLALWILRKNKGALICDKEMSGRQDNDRAGNIEYELLSPITARRGSYNHGYYSLLFRTASKYINKPFGSPSRYLFFVRIMTFLGINRKNQGIQAEILRILKCIFNA